jgi:hypothetical protein
MTPKNSLWSIRTARHSWSYPGVGPIAALIGLCRYEAMRERLQPETWYKRHIVSTKRVTIVEEK